MRIRALPIIAMALLALVTCTSEKADETQVAVHNLGKTSIDATVSDGELQLDFANVAAETTSTFQTATFADLSGLTVTVGGVASTIDLHAGKRNVVDVAADGKVRGVSVPSTGGDSEEGW